MKFEINVLFTFILIDELGIYKESASIAAYCLTMFLWAAQITWIKNCTMSFCFPLVCQITWYTTVPSRQLLFVWCSLSDDCQTGRTRQIPTVWQECCSHQIACEFTIDVPPCQTSWLLKTLRHPTVEKAMSDVKLFWYQKPDDLVILPLIYDNFRHQMFQCNSHYAL